MKIPWTCFGFLSLSLTTTLAASPDINNAVKGKTAAIAGSNKNPALVNANHSSMQYSLALLQKINSHFSSTISKQQSTLNTENIPLERLGLSGINSASTVKDLYNHLNVRLSDKYQYSLQPIPTSLSKASASSKELSVTGNMLMMPFSDIFTLEPGSIRYMSNLLNIFSNVNPQNAKILAPSFGLSSKSLHSPEATKSVSQLLAAISNMDPKSLDYISKSKSATSSDPLVTKGSLFTLSNILAVSPSHLDSVTKLFDALSQMNVSEMRLFLQNIGWQSSDSDENKGNQSNSSDSIPDLSYLLPVNEDMLSTMTHAAKLSLYDIPGFEQITDKLQSDVNYYLKEARSFWKKLPEYLTVASLLTLSGDPLVGDLVQFLTIAYKNPDASFWQLVLLYYKSIGMPGLQAIIDGPSQYIGSLASSAIGGYVSDVVTSLVASILDLKPTITSLSSLASSLPTATSPLISTLINTSASATSTSFTAISTHLPIASTLSASRSIPSITQSSASSAIQSPQLSLSTSPSIPYSSSSISSSTTLPRPSTVASLSSPAVTTATSSTTTMLQTTSNISGNSTPSISDQTHNSHTTSSTSSSSSTYDFWGFLSYFSPGKPNLPIDPEVLVSTSASSTSPIYGTVMIPHKTVSN